MSSFRTFESLMLIYLLDRCLRRMQLRWKNTWYWLTDSEYFCWKTMQNLVTSYLKESNWCHNEHTGPNLTPSDHYLFHPMIHFQHSWWFTKEKEMEFSVIEFFTSQEKNCYQRTGKRWFQTVQDGSLYFECLIDFVAIWRLKKISYQSIAKRLTQHITLTQGLEFWAKWTIA